MTTPITPMHDARHARGDPTWCMGLDRATVDARPRTVKNAPGNVTDTPHASCDAAPTTRAADQGDATTPAIADLQQAFLDNLFHRQGKFPALANQARLLPRPRLPRARPHAAPLDQHRGRVYAQRLPHGGLSLGGVPPGPAPRQQPREPGHRGRGTPGDRGTRSRSRRAAARGGGTRPRQRWPRSPGGMLPRLARDTADPGAGLRHPIRVRHLPTGDRRRLAGGAHRQLAAQRHAVGRPAARVGGGDQVRRQDRVVHR